MMWRRCLAGRISRALSRDRGAAIVQDTIYAPSTGRPPAAIAIVRVSGPKAHAAAVKLGGELPRARQASLRPLIDPSSGVLIDEALVLRFDAPGTATGENIVEFHCHGGRATVDALLMALSEMDELRLAEPGEFTRRALANGRIDLTEAEGLADLLSAETELQRRSAMVRAGGALRARIDGWRGRILALSARAEVAIDYADEEDGGTPDDLAPELRRLASEMGELLTAPRVEPLRDGIRVVVSGPPNAGKSSLVNALSQSERAIVTAIPGTTRDVIEVPLAISGTPFVLVDTAGLRESADEVEAIGVGRAQDEAERADILLWLGDSEAPSHPNAIKLAAKADLAGSASSGLPVSSLTGEGLTDLLEQLLERAKGLLPRGDELALDRRQHDLLELAAEALRRAAILDDPVLVAEELRIARASIERISGQAGLEELLDTLFGRFCLGK
jgi:tRNA modification GTPase